MSTHLLCQVHCIAPTGRSCVAVQRRVEGDGIRLRPMPQRLENVGSTLPSCQVLGLSHPPINQVTCGIIMTFGGYIILSFFWGRGSTSCVGRVLIEVAGRPPPQGKNMFETCLKPPPSIWLPPSNHWCSPGSLPNFAFASCSAPLPPAMVPTALWWHWRWHCSWWHPAATSHRWSLRTAAGAAARRRLPGAPKMRCCWRRCSSSHWSPGKWPQNC